MDDRCEICGRAGRTVVGWLFDGEGWVQVVVHISCENSRLAKNRMAGMAGRN